ncbi:glycoside hydrolase superfamily [Gorgonomyces haynaldii]|nr:glycoside hydrolase superfamily [Gorgonomyces haynaldii]
MTCRPSSECIQSDHFQASTNLCQRPSDCSDGFVCCSGSGLQFSANVTTCRPVSDCPFGTNNETWTFITRNGTQLLENGEPYRFASFNVPGLLLTEDRGGQWVSPTPEEQEDAILSVKGAEGRVIRTYTLGFGKGYHLTGPREYNEQAFVAMDHALALARKHKIRLLIPIVNNHWGKIKLFGDYADFAALRSKDPSEFFTDHQLRADFKDLLSFLLQRNNTVNGILYKEDSTILALQTGNELGGYAGPPPPSDWTIEMAQHIKSLAPKMLVADGSFGGSDAIKLLRKECLTHPSLDLFSNHYYDADTSRLSREADHVAQFKKAFVVAEFGFSLKAVKSIFDVIYKKPVISGGLVWSLRYHSRDGGFYQHAEDGGYNSFHVPGFSVFGRDGDTMAMTVRSYGLRLVGKPLNTPFPMPNPIPHGIVKGNALVWMGAAWAAAYEVSILSKNNTFVPVGRVSDAKPSGSMLFLDESNQTNQTFRVRPISVNGTILQSYPLILWRLSP